VSNGSLYSDAELDAMSGEEAWDKFCYAAWVTRRDVRKHELMANAMKEAQDEVARAILERLEKATPEELAALTRAASDADASSR
jgi:hypothetical protein